MAIPSYRDEETGKLKKPTIVSTRTPPKPKKPSWRDYAGNALSAAGGVGSTMVAYKSAYNKPRVSFKRVKKKSKKKSKHKYRKVYHKARGISPYEFHFGSVRV